MGATAAGALGGAAIGGALFHGDNAWAGVLGSAVVGGIVGNMIGKNMDRQDRANMRSAIVNTPVNQQATWTNQKTRTTYVVRPIRNYRSPNHRYCREYQTTITVGGRERKAYGRACREPDGSWRIVK